MTSGADEPLAPDDLRIEDSSDVRSLGDRRFVVGTGDAAPRDQLDAGLDDVTEDGPTARYTFDVTATVDGDRAAVRLADDDVTRATAALFQWAVGVVAPGTDPDEALGLLLLASDDGVAFPPNALRRVLAEYDVGPDDTVADLVAAVEADDAFTVPGRR
jgi:hypothetical protein